LLVQKVTIFESVKGSRIGLVFIRSDRGGTACWNNTSHEFLHAFLRCLGIRPTVLGFENGSLLPLRGSHGAATTQLRFSHPVDEVRAADEKIQVKGPVLAVLEGSKTV
jgi:hypothetical protein